MKKRIWLAALVVGFGCGVPLGPISGGALSGEVTPAPADWAFANGIERVQLETNPAAPHSVNTWIGSNAGELYLPTSMIRGPKLPTEREWLRNAVADERVRLRIGDAVYELRAERVIDETEALAARTELEKKHELGADDVDPAREIWIFRLASR